MKKYSLPVFILFTLVATGCNKYLEQAPDTRTELNSSEKVKQLLGTAYPQACYVTFAEAMTDNVEDKGAGTMVKQNEDPFYFRDVKASDEDSPEFYWDKAYAAIAAANQALYVCDHAADPQNYQAQKGEALVARAYAHFMLANFFSKFYDPTTADRDLGIPYVTEPEEVLIKKYERKTVRYVYDMIEKDLTEGLPLLKDELYKVPRYHFNSAAAHAFAVRFYLFKKDYDKVIDHANAAFPGNNFAANMRPWNTTNQSLSIVELFTSYTKATENANLLLIETASLYARNYGSYKYGLGAAKQFEIFQKNVTGGDWAFTIGHTGLENYLIPKFNEYFVKVSINANTGQPYTMLPALTTEEVLLSRAEAYLYKGNTDAAIGDLNTFISKRIRDYDAASHNLTSAKLFSFYKTSNLSDALLAAILDFRRVEYTQEGMRWFDILRYKIPVTHVGNSGGMMTLNADNPYRVLQIPPTAIEAGLEPNPR